MFLYLFFKPCDHCFWGWIICLSIFCKENPDYIRSEHYQLQKQQLTMLGDSNNKGNANMNLLPIVKPGENLADDKIIEQ